MNWATRKLTVVTGGNGSKPGADSTQEKYSLKISLKPNKYVRK
jgi:hypothetical protein